MNIAIIGGGWIGCHLANKLKNHHDITVFEKNNSIFSETSFNNQNRLHLGFHYARNYKTRKLCLDTFDRFLNDYGKLTKKIDKNLYCVPSHTSVLDFETYLQIFKDFSFSESKSPTEETLNCIDTNEIYIDFNMVKIFFESKLNNNIIFKEIFNHDLPKIKKEFDLVINATNNHLNTIKTNDFYYELTISLIYNKKNIDVGFGALTLVDGPLFSIYPYSGISYTVTDVEHTPIKKFKDSKKIKSFIKSKINDKFISEKKINFENKILKFYPEFLNDFEYSNYFLSTKSKINDLSDERYPVIIKEDNLINCFTGKIQGIYIIEDYINDLLK